MEKGWSAKELHDQIRADAEARTAATAGPAPVVLFSWIRDSRVIAAQEGLRNVATALGALEKTTEEITVADDYIKQFKERMQELIDG